MDYHRLSPGYVCAVGTDESASSPVAAWLGLGGTGRSALFMHQICAFFTLIKNSVLPLSPYPERWVFLCRILLRPWIWMSPSHAKACRHSCPSLFMLQQATKHSSSDAYTAAFACTSSSPCLPALPLAPSVRGSLRGRGGVLLCVCAPPSSVRVFLCCGPRSYAAHHG